MTPARSLVELFIAPLNRARIEYVVTGGLAAIMYGHPRLTLDVDLVIRLGPLDIDRFAELWPPDQFYCPPLEVIAEERARVAHGHFNLIHSETAMRADVYMAGDDAMQTWALEHRLIRDIDGEAVQFAPIEYVIAYKLRYYKLSGSDRHLRDVARMLAISGATVDERTLQTWIDRLDLGAAWAKVPLVDGPE